MLVQISDNVFYVVMGGWEWVERSKAVGCTNNNSSCSPCDDLCKHRIVLWNSTYETSTMNVKVKRVERLRKAASWRRPKDNAAD
jgi:hypothetical protein